MFYVYRILSNTMSCQHCQGVLFVHTSVPGFEGWGRNRITNVLDGARGAITGGYLSESHYRKQNLNPPFPPIETLQN